MSAVGAVNSENVLQYGYQFGSSQPVRMYTVKFDLKPPQDRHKLQAILHERFGLPEWSNLPSVVSDADPNLVDVAWWLAQLSNSLLRALRLPIEFPGVVVAVDEQNQSAQLALACFDRRCEQWRVKTINAAAAILKQLQASLAQTPQTLEQRIVALQASIMEKLVEPSRKNPLASVSERTVIASYLAANIPITACTTTSWRAGWGARSELISGSAIERDSAIGAQLSDNKASTAVLLKQAGLPAATHQVVGSSQAAIRAAEIIGYPLVVKPVNLDRREGVTVGIKNQSELLAALKKVTQLGAQQALVEQQAPGCCHRIYVRNGEFQYAVKRHPKSVEGDGQSTIYELIAKFNRKEQRKAPWLRLQPAPDDAKAELALGEQGYFFSSILAEKEKVYLRPVEDPEEELWGSGMTVVTEHIHPENRLLAETLSRLFGLSSIGIDLITPDISQPWQSNGAIVNEVNYSPNMASPQHRAASYLVPLFEKQRSKVGRIPIHLYLGPFADTAALDHHRRLSEQGINSYFADSTGLTDSNSATVPCLAETLFARLQAALLHPKAEALVVSLVSTQEGDQWMRSGSPVDLFDSVTLVIDSNAADERAWQQLADSLIKSAGH